MKKAVSLFTLMLIFIAVPSVSAQDSWQLKKDEAGIKVFTRKLSDEKAKEIRVLAELPGTPAQLASVVMDVNNHKKWVYGLQETRLLKRVNKNSIIYYNVTDLPWPVSNRDMVLQMTLSEDPNSSQTSIRSRTIKDYMPPQKGNVRVPYSNATWKITPVNEKKVLAEYIFSVDPGGSLPSWLVNKVATTGPYNSFVELRKIMEGKQ